MVRMNKRRTLLFQLWAHSSTSMCCARIGMLIYFACSFGRTTFLHWRATSCAIRGLSRNIATRVVISPRSGHHSWSTLSLSNDDPSSSSDIAKQVSALFDDNVFQRWSLDDDRTLYEGFVAGRTVEDLCSELKRGYQGAKARLRHIQDPTHKAFFRLFGGDPDCVERKVSLRPCGDVIQRILWDKLLDVNDFSFVYEDR